LTCCLIIFIFARAELIGGLMPFLPAFYAAGIYKNKKTWPILLISSLAGLWFSNFEHKLMIYLTILVVLSILLLFMKDKKDKHLKVSFVVMIVIFAVKLCFDYFYGLSFYKLINSGFEAVLAATLVPSYIEVNDYIKNPKKKILNKEYLIGLILLVFGLFVGINELYVNGFSISGLLSRYLLLNCSYIFGPGISTPCGVLIGLIPGISSSFNPQLVGIYAFSALLGGLLRKMGRVVVAVGFILGHLLFSVYIVDPWDINIFLLETAVSVVAFLITPNIIINKMNDLLPDNFFWSHENENKEFIVNKLNRLERIFQELSRVFKQYSSEIGEKEEEGINKLLSTTAGKNCRDCPMFGICWQKDVRNTFMYLKEMFKLAKTKTLTSDDIPYEIKKRCQRPHELALTINYIHEAYQINSYWQEKILETKGLVSEQLNSVSTIINNLCDYMLTDSSSEHDKENKIFNRLQDIGINVESVAVSKIKDNNNYEIEIVKEPCCKGKMECEILIKPLVEEIFGQEFAVDRSKCALKKGSLLCSCILIPASCFEISVGFAGAKGAGSMVSGDSYWHTSLKGGKHIIVLSDGMGVGARANKESSAAVQLVQKLLDNGFTAETAIKTVNSILSMRSCEEVFATLDLTIVDLYSGEAEIFKIGASPSFIKRGKAVGLIKSSSLPIGIVDKVEVQSVIKKLRPGDFFIMMTDGVLEANKDLYDKERWMSSILKEMKEEAVKEMAELILKHAAAVIDGPIKDDMSVAVFCLKER
jgi:stage II sporulation protein E